MPCLKVHLTPCAQVLQAADCSIPSRRRLGMVADTGYGARQVRRSANGTRCFVGKAQGSGTAWDRAQGSDTVWVDRTAVALLGCVLAHTGRAVQPSSRANSRPRSR
jgi:hypothetical protein